MLHFLLWGCALLSLPFLGIYLFYTFLVASLPDYRHRAGRSLGLRLERIVAESPLYFVFLLPCLNEEKVLASTIRAILALPYRHLCVVVVDDASEDGTPAVAREMNDPRVRVLQRRMPHARQGKGEALNFACQKVSRAVSRMGLNPHQVIVAIIDGDGRPSENLIDEAIDAFADASVGAAQSRIRITNRTRLLPLMQDLEFATTVGAIQNSRAYFGSVGLGGNGQFTRLSTLRSLGDKPWTRCLLEDFDIGLRILLRGWKTRFIGDGYVAQQGLVSLRRFIRQRARWVQGNIQCLRYVAQIRKSGMPVLAKIDLFYFLSQPWMNLLGTMLQLASWIALTEFIMWHHTTIPWLHGYVVPWILNLTLWVTIILGPGFVWATMYFRENWKERFTTLIVAGLFLPIYNLLVIPSVWLAFWRHFTRQNSWVKTERIPETNPITLPDSMAVNSR